MPKPKDPTTRALDGVLRALSPLNPAQRQQCMQTVKYVIDRAAPGALVEPKKARAKKQPAPPPQADHV